ncbi:MAG: MAP7 domain-containing protein [Bacteroidales bacterium]|nr:MAP7 domain-containing protein [Bacteroidales bacterium]
MKVKKWLKRTGIVMGCLVAFVIVVMVVLAVILSRPSVQNRVLHYAVSALSEKLQTHVQADSVSIDVVGQKVSLYGLDVEDQQQRPMLAIDTLSVRLDFWALIQREVKVSKAAVYGVEAHLLKPSKEETANYQFVIDAFRKDSTDRRDTANDSKGKKLTFDVKQLSLHRIHVFYNDQEASFSHLTVRQRRQGYMAVLNGLQAQWVSMTKKGPVRQQLQVQSVDFADGRPKHLSLEGVHFVRDNDLPRKNVGKPNRGAFDAGHLDVWANMECELQHVGADSVCAVLLHTTATDSVSGIDLRDLRCGLVYRQKQLRLTDVFLQQRSTTLSIDSVLILLPDTTVERPLQYHTSPISGHVVLQDISQLFSPALSKFAMPLELTAEMNGTNTDITFRNVRVNTADQRLNILANGQIDHLDNGRDMVVRFHVSKMVAKGQLTAEILNQFKVNKLMMKQFDALGTIGYTGDFRVLWRREEFRGTLTTQEGNLHFNFALDGQNHYLTGSAKTTGFRLAQLFMVEALGPVSFNADFKIDISKQRTSQMRRKYGGKLPIGSVRGTVSECSYKKVTLHNLDVDIESDGANANGTVMQRGRHVDVWCNFVMTSTDSIRQMKVRPKLKIHGLSEEDRQAKEEQKEQHRREKADRRDQRRKEKAERRQQRAEKREQRRQQRAEKKAQREAENQAE